MTELTWDSAAEWDAAASESGVVHESVANTDHADASIVKQGYSAASPFNSASLVACWLFQEDSGTTAHDFSGGAHDLSATGSTPNVPGGLLNTSYWSMDGTDDEFTSTETTPWNFAKTDPFTVASWVKMPDQNRSSGGPWSVVGHVKDASPFQNWVLGVTGDPVKFRINMRDDTGSSAGVVGTTTVDDASWHLGIFRNDPSNSQIELLVDGNNLEGTDPHPAGSITNSYGLYVGYNRPGDPNYWPHDRGPMWIWNTRLTNTEIQALYDVTAASGSLITAEKLP